jgi:hypothetical protein
VLTSRVALRGRCSAVAFLGGGRRAAPRRETHLRRTVHRDRTTTEGWGRLPRCDSEHIADAREVIQVRAPVTLDVRRADLMEKRERGDGHSRRRVLLSLPETIRAIATESFFCQVFGRRTR